MFVNISPADYNQDETVTALTYATRVKLITNTAEKQQVKERIGGTSNRMIQLSFTLRTPYCLVGSG